MASVVVKCGAVQSWWACVLAIDARCRPYCRCRGAAEAVMEGDCGLRWARCNRCSRLQQAAGRNVGMLVCRDSVQGCGEEGERRPGLRIQGLGLGSVNQPRQKTASLACGVAVAATMHRCLSYITHYRPFASTLHMAAPPWAKVVADVPHAP